MPKNIYEINTENLYKDWKKSNSQLFRQLGMEKEHERIVSEDKKEKELRIQTLKNANDEGKIDEAFAKELVKWADSGRKSRSKFIKVYYKGVAKTKGWITFNTTSQYTPGKFYYQYVKLLDIKDIKHLKDLDKKGIVRLLLAGNISCYCSCPDHKFKGFKYMGYTQGYGIYREARFPRIKNPKLEGSVCKHMLAVLSVMMFSWMVISRDLQNSYFWKARYGED